MLQSCIQEKQLQAFYPPNSPVIEQIAQRAPALINQVIQRWRVVKEVANDIVKLALYDIVLYIGKEVGSTLEAGTETPQMTAVRCSLKRVVNASRTCALFSSECKCSLLRNILTELTCTPNFSAFAATLFDVDGISVRFMNTDLSALREPNGRPLQDGVATEAQIDNIMRGVQFKGLTPMGTSLRKKVIDEIVLSRANSNQLKKPVLVITITDGQPAGEPGNAVMDTIRYAFDALKRTPYGAGALAFEFAQVGNDELAKKFLGKLDEDPVVGPMVDCTSSRFNAINFAIIADKCRL